MKRLLNIGLITTFIFSTISCQTSYDAYGNPRQTVDPGVAVAGAVAAGVVGLAIANNRNNRNDRFQRNNFRNQRHNRHVGYYDRFGNFYRH